MSDAEATMEPRQLKDLSGWLIVWPTGPEQHVSGFRTEAAARAWIKKESKPWIAKAKRPRHG
jgi:hypothetical protein